MPALRKHRRAPQQGESLVDDTLPVIQAASDAPDRNAMIADAAYFHAENRGFAPGHELEDWLAAEREIDAGREQAGAAAPGH